MYTVKEIADLLEVSQVTIYNHLNKNDNEMKGLTRKKKGVTHIKEEGLRVLKISMGLIQVPTIEKEEMSPEDLIDQLALTVADNIKLDYEELKEELSEVKEQNRVTQEQNKTIKEQNDRLIELIEGNQANTLLGKFKGLFKQ